MLRNILRRQDNPNTAFLFSRDLLSSWLFWLLFCIKGGSENLNFYLCLMQAQGKLYLTFHVLELPLFLRII